MPRKPRRRKPATNRGHCTRGVVPLDMKVDKLFGLHLELNEDIFVIRAQSNNEVI